jgi:hypothetical protein
MASKQLKTKIVSALMKNHGYGKENAENLIEKHIDVIEANEEDMTAEALAQQVEEQDMQRYDEDEE